MYSGSLKQFFLAFLSMSLLCNLSLNANSTKYETEEYNNIQYYENDSIACDLTMLNLIKPKDVENPPVLIWIGQGAWAYVDRNKEMNICRKIAENGIVVVSAGHRLSPALLMEPVNNEGISHPEHIKDIAMAFKWVYEHSNDYGYSKNIFVGGYSSGAHLSALLAMDSRYLTGLGLSTDLINGIIPVSGGYDIPEYRELLIAEAPDYEQKHIIPVFGETQEDYIDASPITYIDSLKCPVLMMSDANTIIYSKGFEEKLSQIGYSDLVSVNIYDRTHRELWMELGGEGKSIYRDMIIDFIFRKSESKEKKE